MVGEMALEDLNVLTEKIIGVAIEVHRELGPGLLESVYQRCLAITLRDAGFGVEEEKPVPICFRGQQISDDGYRMDMLVNDTVILELKSVAALTDVFKKQLLTYLKLTGKPIGLLINFNEVMLKNGIKRIINF
jgi:GxxExxY protein